MAKKSVVQRNLRRQVLVEQYAERRSKLKATVRNTALSMGERFSAQLELNSLPKDSSKVRLRNRCLLTGRGRGYYRKFKVSRICLRELASSGAMPGLRKASW
ncbi:30S ribosomal subunit protein S14 [Alphaproteobacteria bacterium]